MKKIVAINKDLGVFLGTVSGCAIFSKNDPIGIQSAVGFTSIEEAESYFDLLPKAKKDLFFIEVESRTMYPTCVDIIKAGYGKYADEMFEIFPSPSDHYH